VKLQFRETEIATFIRIFNENKLNVSNFNGCLGMRLLNDLQNPPIFYTYSQWESEDALNNYRKSTIFNTVWISIKPLFELPAEACSTVVYFDSFILK
jgi:quinol monooxygenase YgiN